MQPNKINHYLCTKPFTMPKCKLLVLFIILSGGLFAQDSLFFTRSVYNIPRLDTFSNNTFSITDSIYSLRSGGFIGNINFAARVNGTLVSYPQFISDTIAPNDTIGINPQPLLFRFTNDTAPPFVIGTNAVVIWPIIAGGAHPTPSFDSIYINTHYYPLDIKESPLAHMFIFQMGGHLNIVFGDAENVVQQVRIYDLLGQGIYADSPDRSRDIPTQGWNKGIYLCEITTFSGERRTFKFKLE